MFKMIKQEICARSVELNAMIIECNYKKHHLQVFFYFHVPEGADYVPGAMHKILAHFQLIKVSPVLADCAPSLPVVG